MNLKPIEKEAIPRALTKAERYRLLNEPREAESICLDVLAIEPGNVDAIACLILSLTDLFEGLQVSAAEVRPLVGKLTGEYERSYYAGMIEERWAKALIKAEYQSSIAYEIMRKAMEHFEAAQALAPRHNDDAALRWNTCVRTIERHHLGPHEHTERSHDAFGDDVPMR
jgi:hypothetical protein